MTFEEIFEESRNRDATQYTNEISPHRLKMIRETIRLICEGDHRLGEPLWPSVMLNKPGDQTRVSWLAGELKFFLTAIARQRPPVPELVYSSLTDDSTVKKIIDMAGTSVTELREVFERARRADFAALEREDAYRNLIRCM